MAVLVGSILEIILIDSKYIFYTQGTAVSTAEDTGDRVTGTLMVRSGDENPTEAGGYNPQQGLVSPFHIEEGLVTSTSLSDR